MYCSTAHLSARLAELRQPGLGKFPVFCCRPKAGHTCPCDTTTYAAQYVKTASNSLRTEVARSSDSTFCESANTAPKTFIQNNTLGQKVFPDFFNGVSTLNRFYGQDHTLIAFVLLLQIFVEGSHVGIYLNTDIFNHNLPTVKPGSSANSRISIVNFSPSRSVTLLG